METTTTNNLEVWNALAKPPQSALKQIQAGRQKGKSDINPQWRYQAMTEQFGPIGIGWKYEISRLWTEPGAKEEVMCFATVNVYIKDTLTGAWSEPVPGIGGNTLIAKETNGLYNNDEAFKMAVTDALSVALKMFGVAAEVYLGNFDGSKFIERKDPTPAAGKVPLKPRPEGQPAVEKKPAEDPIQLAIRASKTSLVNAAKKKGYVAEDVAELVGDCLKKLNEAKTIDQIDDARKACVAKIEAAPDKAPAEAPQPA
jgi:hypothetical protein